MLVQCVCVCVCVCPVELLEFELKCSAWHIVQWECAVGCISFFCSLA